MKGKNLHQWRVVNKRVHVRFCLSYGIYFMTGCVVHIHIYWQASRQTLISLMIWLKPIRIVAIFIIYSSQYWFTKVIKRKKLGASRIFVNSKKRWTIEWGGKQNSSSHRETHAFKPQQTNSNNWRCCWWCWYCLSLFCWFYRKRKYLFLFSSFRLTLSLYSLIASSFVLFFQF